VDFLSQNALYVVLLIVLVVWLGVFLYLYRIDRRLKVLEDANKKGSQ
jgi:CcmD family protein